MKSPHLEIVDRLTPAQRRAVTARGNVLVMAGAGTGKTHTLVERCLHCLCEEQPPHPLDEILVVTFTEAAAAEMRQRLRERLEEKLQAAPRETRWAEQLALFDTGYIGTLHSFCLKLVREHFHELGLDPQWPCSTLARRGCWRTKCSSGIAGPLRRRKRAGGSCAETDPGLRQWARPDIRQLVLQLHHYAQTRPDADGWLARQLDQFAAPAPDAWRAWLLTAIHDWRNAWLAALEMPGAPNSSSARSLSPQDRAGPEFGAHG